MIWLGLNRSLILAIFCLKISLSPVSWSFKDYLAFLNTGSILSSRNFTFIQSCRIFQFSKKLSLCHKLKFFNPYICAILWCKPFIFQTKIIWCADYSRLWPNTQFERPTTFFGKDIRFTNQSLWQKLNSFALVL